MKISILNQYISKHLLPRWIILLLDMLTVVFSCMLAYILFLGVSRVNASVYDMIYFTSLVSLFTFLSFYVFKTYAGVLRYSSFLDILRIFVALTVAYVGAFVSVSILASLEIIQNMNVPIVIIAMITNFTLMSSGRVIVKLTIREDQALMGITVRIRLSMVSERREWPLQSPFGWKRVIITNFVDLLLMSQALLEKC